MSRRSRDFWDDQDPTPEDVARGEENRLRVLRDLIAHGADTDKPLDTDRVAKWHKWLFEGLSHVAKDDECYLGAYRGSRHRKLKSLRVGVGGVRCVEPEDVPREVARFFDQLERKMAGLASEIARDEDKSGEELRQIAEVAGWAHGEWVRIHPFANGSGRTARSIANWVLVRFGLLPVVGIRPRPEGPFPFYELAASASMGGDHRKIVEYIIVLLEDPKNRA